MSPDWELPALLAKFREQMARRCLLIWGTGREGVWLVEVSIGPSSVSGSREVSGGIVCSKGRLCLTNYESLTMAAQFEDVTLPEAHQRELVFELPPGTYRCRIVQRATPDPAFVIELQPATETDAPWTTVPWGPFDQP